MKRLGCALALGPAGVGTAWAACGDTLPAAGRQPLERAGVQLVYAPQGGSVPLGRHFALDIEVCAAAGGAAPALLRVDADMPAHRHGMNYRSSLRTLAPSRYVAEGLMWHMPGRWRLIFELAGPPGQPVQRITHELVLE